LIGGCLLLLICEVKLSLRAPRGGGLLVMPVVAQIAAAHEAEK